MLPQTHAVWWSCRAQWPLLLHITPAPSPTDRNTHTHMRAHLTVWAPSPPLPGVTRSLSEGGGITLAWQTSQALDVAGENATEELGRYLRYLIMFSGSNYSDEGKRPR